MSNNFETPVVSVCIFTYNHEPYIAQCIESVLMQRTNFPFEIIIGEDYSLDQTRKICRAYAEKYKDKIILLERAKNLGISINTFDTIRHAKGKYIAVLDGDDYWIHPFKLQKQYECLEKNDNINLVFHQTIQIDERFKNKIGYFVKTIKPLYTLENIVKKWLMATGSMFFRRETMDYPDFLDHTHNVDFAIQLIQLKDNSEAMYLDEVMSVYRLNVNSNNNKPEYNFENNNKRKIELLQDFNEYTRYRYDKILKAKITDVKRLTKREKKPVYKIKVYIINKIKEILFPI